MRTFLLFAVGLGGLLGIADLSFAQTWTQTGAANTNWFSIASSADGSILFAVGGNTNYQAIYKSTNSGNAWVQTGAPTTNLYPGIAVSADGVKVMATSFAGGNSAFALAATPTTNDAPVFISTNSGDTWAASMGPTTNVPQKIASSADGQTLIVGTYQGWAYFSTDLGATWNSNRLFSGNGVFGVVAAADGCRLIANLGSALWSSTNWGATWVRTIIMPSAPIAWQKNVATSADGFKLVAVGTFLGHRCFGTSPDAGITWMVNSNNNYFIIGSGWVASSASGSTLAEAQSLGSIFISTDSGSNWIQTASPYTNWSSVVLSADGSKLTATVAGVTASTNATGGIWTFQVPPAPQLNLTTLTNNLTIAWTVPSTNFVLQQSLDFTSWSDVTNTPVLNFTNLQYQVSLAPSNSGGFFRLMSQ
jgi:hypothetical protein